MQASSLCSSNDHNFTFKTKTKLIGSLLRNCQPLQPVSHSFKWIYNFTLEPYPTFPTRQYGNLFINPPNESAHMVCFKRKSPIRSFSLTLPHIHHNLYRCLRPRWDSYHHKSRIDKQKKMDRYLHRLTNKPLCHLKSAATTISHTIPPPRTTTNNDSQTNPI